VTRWTSALGSEDSGASSHLNHATIYRNDVLDELALVRQGGQMRTFDLAGAPIMASWFVAGPWTDTNSLERRSANARVLSCRPILLPQGLGFPVRQQPMQELRNG
jgi:hypothetical protein